MTKFFSTELVAQKYANRLKEVNDLFVGNAIKSNKKASKTSKTLFNRGEEVTSRLTPGHLMPVSFFNCAVTSTKKFRVVNLKSPLIERSPRIALLTTWYLILFV